jgi:hypothetical protein
LSLAGRSDYVTRADEWARELTTCEAELFCNDASVDHGRSVNVLGRPLTALRALVAVLAVDSHNPPLAASWERDSASCLVDC